MNNVIDTVCYQGHNYQWVYELLLVVIMEFRHTCQVASGEDVIVYNMWINQPVRETNNQPRTSIKTQ